MRVFPIKFTGSYRAFTRLYLANLFFSVITLGLFAAWARARQRRYLFANTSISHSGFYFHARPVQQLNTDLLVFTLVTAYFVIEFYSFTLALLLFTGFLFLLPELMNNSLATNLGQTSFRNLRFHFSPDYKEAFVVFSLLLIAVVLSAGLAYPYYVYRRRKYILEHSSYGQSRFHFDAKALDYYRFYTNAVVILLLAAGTILVVVKALKIFAGLQDTATYIGLTLAVPVLLYHYCYLNTRLFNYEMEKTRIDSVHFMTDLRASRVYWIYFSNLCLVAGSFGLLLPVAILRMIKYKLSVTAFCIEQDWASFSAAPAGTSKTLTQKLRQLLDSGLELLQR